MANVRILGGAGYVGLSYAVAFAHLGHNVVAIDVNPEKIRVLSAGQPTIFEPNLEEMLQQGLASGRLRFTDDYAAAAADAEFAFICVGTPSDNLGRAETRYIVAAARMLAEHSSGHTIVVNKSTMPVGSVELVAEILAEHAQDGATFSVVANPEFLREGAAIHDILHPDRIVIGTHDPRAAEQLSVLYQPLGASVVVTDPRSAEMIKYASNAFLATKISFINEVALICEQLGADVAAVATGMGLDERIGPRFLNAGAGFGGSCFPKDLRALASMAQDAGLSPAILQAVIGINQSMRLHVRDVLSRQLNGLPGKTITILGLSFKPDTDDVREAPAVEVIRELLADGATIRATDPAAMGHVASLFPQATFHADAYEASMSADAVVIMTEWNEYRSLDLHRIANAMRGRLVFDARNCLDPAAVLAAGLTYKGIGRAMPMLQPVRLVERAAYPSLLVAAAD
jgi:UDPglucose 6-dehydrogenase